MTQTYQVALEIVAKDTRPDLVEHLVAQALAGLAEHENASEADSIATARVTAVSVGGEHDARDLARRLAASLRDVAGASNRVSIDVRDLLADGDRAESAWNAHI